MNHIIHINLNYSNLELIYLDINKAVEFYFLHIKYINFQYIPCNICYANFYNFHKYHPIRNHNLLYLHFHNFISIKLMNNNILFSKKYNLNYRGLNYFHINNLGQFYLHYILNTHFYYIQYKIDSNG